MGVYFADTGSSAELSARANPSNPLMARRAQNDIGTTLTWTQNRKLVLLVFRGFWPVFGQSWAQEPAQRPQLEKRYINQRKLARGIDSKAQKKTKIENPALSPSQELY